MSRIRMLTQAALLACSVAALPAAAQSVGADQGGSPAPVAAQPHPQRQKFIERFNAANTTGDGHLTLAQAEAGQLPMLARHFNEIDVQHKGYVTLQDIRAYRQHIRAAREGAGNPAD